MIHTGMFNKKASFFRLVSSVNDFGARDDVSEELVFESFVYLSHLRNSEFLESRKLSDKSKLRLRVRYHPKIFLLDTVDCFVKIDNVYWNILSIENVLNRNNEFLLYLEHRNDGN